MNSTVRLFKALPVKNKKTAEINSEIMSRTIKSGFVFSPVIFANYSNEELVQLASLVEQELGLTGKQANSSFHKSWSKVRDASIEQLMIEQIIHYWTTYGAEAFGVYDVDNVYIPLEELNVPELDLDKVSLVCIAGYTKNELKQKLLSLLESGIALHEDTISDVVDVAKFVGVTVEEVESIQNRQVRVVLYDHLGVVPKEPLEFFRYLMFKITNNSLVIKNRKTVLLIRECMVGAWPTVEELIGKYERNMGLEPLASVFYRFKPLFLALRTTTCLKNKVNKIRKLAVKYHEPMREDFLNSVTAKLCSGRVLDFDKLDRELNRVSVFRKVRLAYALKYRTKDVDSIFYRVRNGKGYVKEFNYENKFQAGEVLNRVIDSIAQDVSKNVSGKKIYIPDHINYTLPATEKQFVGMFPSGTNVTIDNDMVFGVYWENVGRNRIDLDLALISIGGDKFGWDSFYRDKERNVMFSGDMTDANGGASELFYVKKQAKSSYLVTLNYFNHQEDVPVPTKIFVGSEKINKLNHNYMVDPNNIVVQTKTKLDKKQITLGFVDVDEDKSTFYFAECGVGNSITSGYNQYTKMSLDYLFNFYTNSISLKEVFEKAGAIFTTQEECDIDLSPEKLEKDTIISLLKV